MSAGWTTPWWKLTSYLHVIDYIGQAKKISQWRFTPLSTLFQTYQGYNSDIYVFPEFHQSWAEALNYLA